MQKQLQQANSNRIIVNMNKQNFLSMNRYALLMRSELIEQRNRQQLAPAAQMFQSIQYEKFYEIQELFQNYPSLSIDSQDENGNTFLIMAAQTGNIDVVNLLLSRNANVNVQNNEGNTALHYAIAYAQNDVADLLLSQGAFQNLKNKEGKTPWDMSRAPVNL